jgi:hypothetical protein
MPIPSDWAQNLKEFVNGWPKLTEDGRMVGSNKDYLGDNPFVHFVLTEKAESWDEFLAWVNELGEQWCFRGQRDASWNLDTSLDRAVYREHAFDNSSGLRYRLNWEQETRNLLFRFQQQAHQYVDELPPRDDLGSWFALMQHYGVPTCLLDWTRSPYVALYFAFEEKPPNEGCALWAIDLDWLEKKSRKLLSDDVPASAWDDVNERTSYVNRLLGETKKFVILSVDPLQLDARMVAQQGFFLCNLFHEAIFDEATFSRVLISMIMNSETSDVLDIPDRPVVRKLVLPSKLRIEFLKRLRAMNIHRASLFPGLDGFGKSLRLDLEMKDLKMNELFSGS